MNPVLTTTTRNGHVEIIHRGAFCVIDAEDRVIAQAGDIHGVTYPRSAMKFIQTMPMIISGAAEAFGITPEEIAVMCGSHNAEALHLETVRRILRKAGAQESDLNCGPHEPMGPQAQKDLILSGEKPTAIHNNCSGKHAGFLVLARHLGATFDGYLDLDHPVQRAVRQAVSIMHEMEEKDLVNGVDGCSAPNYAMPLIAMARAYRNLVRPEKLPPSYQSAAPRIVHAVSHHPFMVAGSCRYCTDLMEAIGDRVVSKIGAAGIYCMALREKGYGIAIKIDDGAKGPQYNVAQALLKSLGIFPAGPDGAPAMPLKLEKYLETPILNCNGWTVGLRKVTDALPLSSS